MRDRGGPVGDAELVVDGQGAGLDRCLADVESVGDLGVGRGTVNVSTNDHPTEGS